MTRLPSTVPASLGTIARRLRCPVCAEPLAPGPGSLICRHGHSYDVARHGYVTLRAPRGSAAVGDDAGMVAARLAVHEAGHFEPLTVALAQDARRVALAEEARGVALAQEARGVAPAEEARGVAASSVSLI